MRNQNYNRNQSNSDNNGHASTSHEEFLANALQQRSRNVDFRANLRDDETEQSSETPGTGFPDSHEMRSDPYDQFINAGSPQQNTTDTSYLGTNRMQPAYNNVFVDRRVSSNRRPPPVRIPSISVTNAGEVIPNSPNVIHDESTMQYNDDAFYYNDNLNNPRRSNETNLDQYSNIVDYQRQDTVPIFNPRNGDYGIESSSYKNSSTGYAGANEVVPNVPFKMGGTTNIFDDKYGGVGDLEENYIDQNGDDYQIYTYLDKDGDMIDPYHDARNLEPFPISSDTNDNYSVLSEEEKVGDSSTISKKQSHLNPENYDNGPEFRTLNVTTTNSQSNLHASNSFASSKDLLVHDEPTDPEPNIVRRNTTVVRKFRLNKGNFVFDSPISNSLVSKYSSVVSSNKQDISNEFRFMRYQAVTCEPNQLLKNNFDVRQMQFLTPRKTELMIVITMYNEDHILLGRTLKGAFDNIKHMVKRTHSKVWGPDAWKKIVVCIVSDGRSKVNEKSLALLSSLGCYQDGFAKDEINGKKVNMHVYEHTTMMNIKSVTDDNIELSCTPGTVPVQMLFCLKEQNQKKINSHRWAFEGFAELLQPNIITLLDAGTMPGKSSIFNLWREFKNPQVGGACGEIKTDIGTLGKNLINPLVASQNFEYKMSNILDKTTESNFGFITVLPGAFSAYRFEAVKGQPLEKYFYGESMESDQDLHFFSSNMYLAEDRILCFEIVTKKNSNWILKYASNSYAATDVPQRVPEFILQRRRWLNGSFFASVYSICHFYRVWTSGHSFFRKLWITFEFIYLFFNTILSWFSLSSFFLVFRILSLSIAITYHSAFNILSVVFFWIYGVCIMATFILSLGNKPKSTEMFYVLTFIFFAILMCYMIFCSIFLSVKSFENILAQKGITFHGLITKQAFRDLVISMGSTYVLYLVSSIIYLQPWHMLTSFVQYILLSPSYINVLNIYAFCNVHDLSWGTKGAIAKPLGKINAKEDGTFKMEILVSSEEIQADYNKYLTLLNTPTEEVKEEMPFEEKQTGYYANSRSLIIIFWVLTNFGVIAAVLEAGGISDYLLLQKINNVATPAAVTQPIEILPVNATWYLSIILWLVALNAFIRFVGCSLYMSSRIINKLFNW